MIGKRIVTLTDDERQQNDFRRQFGTWSHYLQDTRNIQYIIYKKNVKIHGSLSPIICSLHCVVTYLAQRN